MVPTHKNNRRRPMPWDMGAGGVDDMGKVYTLEKEFLNELLTELSLHEAVRGDLADETSVLISSPDCKPEETLSERNRKRILAATRRVALTVTLVLTLIFHRDIR